MSFAFDAVSNDGEEETVAGGGGRSSSPRFLWGKLPWTSPPSGFPGDGDGGFFGHEEDAAVPLRHVAEESSIPPSPDKFRSDPHRDFPSEPSPFEMLGSNGEAYEQVDDGGVFASVGLDAGRQWRGTRKAQYSLKQARQNAICLEEKDKKEKRAEKPDQ